MEYIVINDSFGSIIKAKRKERSEHLSQEMVAKDLGISRQRYARIEAGDIRKIDTKLYDMILEYFNISPSDINITMSKQTYNYHLYIPYELKYRLFTLLNECNMSSMNELIISILTDYVNNKGFNDAKAEVMDFCNTMISKTFIDAIRKLKMENEIDSILFEELCKQYDDLNPDKIETLKRISKNRYQNKLRNNKRNGVG